MFFTFAICTFWVSRWAAMLLLFHALIFISLPRVVLGLHWSTDILAGIAVAIVLSVSLMPIAIRVCQWMRPEQWLFPQERFLYPFLFFTTFQISTLFVSLREFGAGLVDVLLR
jgi:undecaprenyl-diphosphatase